jgi:hypothetical protein
LKDFSKEKKESLANMAENVVTKLHQQGVQHTPVVIDCDLLFLDDKLTMKFPIGTEYQFQYGIFILYDLLNYPKMSKMVASVGGVINTTISCLTPRSQRNHYVHPTAIPKNTLVTLVIFSKKIGKHIPWIFDLSPKKEELVLPLTVSILFIF